MREDGFQFDQADHPLVDRKDATVEQILRDVAAQVDSRADIRVDTATRRVTLAYKTP